MTSQVRQVKTLSLHLRSDLHLLRKLWHVCTGLIGLSVYVKLQITQAEMAKGLLIFSMIVFALEFLRLKVASLNYYL